MSGGQLSPLFTWRSAICDSDLPSTSRHVALVLSLHMSERGDSCFPSIPTLADESGYSRRTVQRHLQKLVENGWLEHVGWKKWQTPGGEQRTKKWKAVVPRGRQSDTPLREGGESVSEGGVRESERGRHSDTQGRNEVVRGRTHGGTPQEEQDTTGPRIGPVPFTRS